MKQTAEEFQSKTTEDLTDLAYTFFKKFDKPGIFLVKGEMGAGKTTFISTICKHLGFEFQGSPTFSLVNEYQSDLHRLYHFDLYRINRERELLDFGFEEYLRDDCWVFIEWPDIAERLLPTQRHTITLEDKGDHRLIIF